MNDPFVRLKKRLIAHPPKAKHHYAPVMYTKAWVDPSLPQKLLWRYRPNQHQHFERVGRLKRYERRLGAGVLPTTLAEAPDRLSALFEAHVDRLYGLARRLVPSADDALDLVQETFLKAARSLN